MHARIISGSHASCSSPVSSTPKCCNAHRPCHRVDRRRRQLATSVCQSSSESSNGDQIIGRRKCRLYDLHDVIVPYQQAWDWQRNLVDQVLAAAGTDQDTDFVLLLQHPSVYTLGAGSTVDNILFDPAASQIPLYRTERGGEVTYHGPGQLVMYPIMNLQRHRADLHWYLRSLEQVVIQALEEVSGLEGERVEGMTGVWVDGHKLAAIGIRAKRWVTYHGLALNVVTDLAPFRSIVPCGISGRPVGSVRGMLEDMTMVGDPFLTDMDGQGVQSSRQLLREYRHGLLEAFEQVFNVELQEADAAMDLPGASLLPCGTAEKTALLC